HARLQFEGGRWVLVDLESRNGTRLDGRPVARSTPLTDGQEIVIGATRLQFRLTEGDPPTTKHGPATQVIDSNGTGSSTTHLQTDELTALCRFMAGAVEEADPRDLLRRALRALIKQSGASLAGYLGLDPNDPVPKLVLPDEARVDQHLSRQLTLQ